MRSRCIRLESEFSDGIAEALAEKAAQATVARIVGRDWKSILLGMLTQRSLMVELTVVVDVVLEELKTDGESGPCR